MDKLALYSTILCEGNSNSLDYKIYKKIFPNKQIIPCGANSILKIKEYKHEKFNNVCAITDKDKLNMVEIDELEKHHIFCLRVRAIENLMVSDEALKNICDEMKVANYFEKIDNIKTVLFNKYGAKLNKEFSCIITKNNILLYFYPKRVVGTVSSMLKISKASFENYFYKVLYENKIFNNFINDYL